MIEVKFAKLHEDAKVPTYSTDGSGCFDFYACTYEPKTCAETVTIGTGIAVEIPAGHVLLIFSRSGHGFKNDVRLANCVGVVDSDFRGEVMVKLRKDSIDINTLKINHCDRIAQGMVIPFPKVQFVEVEKLSDTVRGMRVLILVPNQT